MLLRSEFKTHYILRIYNVAIVVILAKSLDSFIWTIWIYYRFITTVGPSEVRRSSVRHHSVAPNLRLAVRMVKAMGQILVYSGGFIYFPGSNVIIID